MSSITWKNKTIGLVMSMMMVASLVFILLPGSTNASTTRIVDKINGPYTTIQSAIIASIDDDIIYVYNTGVYSEFIDINKKLTIIGIDDAYGNPPIIRPPQANGVNIYISSKKVEINNFEISNSLNNYPNLIGIMSIVTDAYENYEVVMKNLNIHNYKSGIKIGTFGSGEPYPRYHTVDSCNIYENTIYGMEIYANLIPDINERAYIYIKDSQIDNNAYGIKCYGDYIFFKNLEVYSNDHYGLMLVGDYCDIWNNAEKSSQYGFEYNTEWGLLIEGDYINIYDGVEIKYNNINDDNSYSGLNIYGDHYWISEVEFISNYIGFAITTTGLFVSDIEYCSFNNELYDVYMTNSEQNTFLNCIFYGELYLDYDDNDNTFDSCNFYGQLTIDDQCDDCLIIDCDFDIDTGNYGIYILLSDNIEITCCDFAGESDSTTAIKVYGSQNIKIYGDSTNRSDINSIETALFTDDYNYIATSVYMKNYDIDNNIKIDLYGNPSYITYVRWNNIPNESNLIITESNAFWVYDNTF